MRELTEDDFKVYPEEITTLPVFDDEDGDLHGFGHIDKDELISVLPKIREYYGIEEEEWMSGVTPEDILYRHAYTTLYDGGEYAFKFCKSDREGSFPVTHIPSI